jgi:hypothetical protein
MAKETGRESPSLSRRALLSGAGALVAVALPEFHAAGSPATKARSREFNLPTSMASAASSYIFLYGVPTPGVAAASSVYAVWAPSRKSRPTSAISIADQLSALPVKSPDQSTLALVLVDTVDSLTSIHLTLLDLASASVAQQGSFSLGRLPAKTSILATPVFAGDSTTVAIVLAVTEPSDWRVITKRAGRGGGTISVNGATWRSHHALAYFDRLNGAFTGPFHLSDEPSLARSTAAANSSDLLLWTARDPQFDNFVKGSMQVDRLSHISAFGFGSAQAKFSCPSPPPWPQREPVVTLQSGDIARLVNGRDLQVCSARTGDIRQIGIQPISQSGAKPGAVTMEARPNGTLFISKPGIGRAVVIDPARGFRVASQIAFPVPAFAAGGPSSKAVLSPAGDVVYVLGGARAGGISAYNIFSGGMITSYSNGRQYSGLYGLPSGALLAIATQNPRLTFFAPSLHQIGTADASLTVSAVF